MNKFARNDLLSLVNWGEAVFSLVWNKGKSHRGQGSHCSAISDIQSLAGAVWPHQGDNGQDGSLGKNPDLIFDQSGLSNCSIGSGGRGRGRGGGDGERGDSIHRFFTPLVQHPTHRSNKSAHFLYPMHYFVIIRCWWKWTFYVFLDIWSELGSLQFLHSYKSKWRK